MAWTRERVERFLNAHLDAGNAMDFGRIRAAYNDPFMFCDPSGARPVPLDPLIAALPARRAFFDAVGQQGTELVSFEMTSIDERYVLVKANLRMVFEKPGSIMFTRISSSFPLRVRTTVKRPGFPPAVVR